MKTGVTIVGYGTQYKLQTSGPPYDRWRGNTRMFAPAQMIQSNDVIAYEYVKLTENPGEKEGRYLLRRFRRHKRLIELEKRLNETLK
jgi:hypothetical protein